MKRWKRRMRRIALALCVTAVVAPAAQAASRPDDRAVGPRTQVAQDFWNYDATGKKIANSSPGVAPNELAQVFAGSTGVSKVPSGFGTDANLIKRHNALAKLSDQSDVASFYSPAQIKAMGDRYNAEAALFGYSAHSAVRPDDRGGIRGVGHAPTVGVAQPSEFDWSDAGIGAVGAVGALLLAALTLVAMRRPRRLAL